MQRTLASLLLLIPFVALAQGGDRVSAYVAGMAALEDSSYGEALRWFERAVAEDPQFADAYFGMAMAYAPESPLHDERRISQSLERAIRLSPDNPRYLEAQLQAYRRTMPEARAYSTTDTRRPVLASRLLAVDPENALAHGELALNAFLEFDWRRQMARRQGGWDPHATGGTSGAANRARARAEEHMIAALRAEPGNISVHRLRLRLAVLAEDNEALERAATSFAVANPANPYAQLYLGLMAHRRGNVEQADLYFDKGIRSMDATERIEFERIVHLMGHGERAAFEADSSTAVSRFWRSRDPRLLSQENERQIEHYARLAMADLLFAEPQNDLRGWETPRGEVVVRYGMPDGHGRWLGADFTAKRFGALERWVYEGEDGFSLVFEDPFRSGDFDFMSSAAGEDDATRARSLFNRMPERYIHRVNGELVDFPSQIATFKSVLGRTTLIAGYGIPLPEGQSDIGAIADLESGAFVLDNNSEVLAEARHTFTDRSPRAVSDGSGGSVPDGFMVDLKPGAYTLALEFEHAAERRIGVDRIEVTLPDYSGPGLQVSDILLAVGIEQGVSGGLGTIERNGLAIAPAPSNRFALDMPIYLYVEVYGLSLQSDRTQYAMEAVLRPRDNAGFLSRAARSIFGGGDPQGVSVTFSATGSHSDDGQYVILDAADQEPGEYELILRVQDLRTREVVETSRLLTLHQSP